MRSWSPKIEPREDAAGPEVSKAGERWPGADLREFHQGNANESMER